MAIADRVGYPVVVKAQVHVGGRGKAGGVKLANDAAECREHATNILGLDIKGHIVKTIWIEKASDIAEEYYASFTLDRSAKKYLGMLSAQGGVEIEAVAEENPDAIAKIWVDPAGRRSEACVPRLGRGGGAQPCRHRRRGRHPHEALHRLRRGRRRSRRDQSAHPQAHRRGPRTRRQGQPRRQRRLRAPGVLRVRRHAAPHRSRGSAHEIGPAVRGPRRRRRTSSRNGAGLAEHRRRDQSVEGAPANFLDPWRRRRRRPGHSRTIRRWSIFINIFGGITRGEEVANGIIEARANGRVSIDHPSWCVSMARTPTKVAILEPALTDKLMMEPTMLAAVRKAATDRAGETRLAAPTDRAFSSMRAPRSSTGDRFDR
ncbi:MAG: ATP-grasp domain-containing protein [Acidimicrobiales bacterium]